MANLNIGCVCGCGMGSSLLLKMLATSVLDDHGIDANVECYDSGTVESNVSLIITSSAFYDGLKEEFGEKVPVVCIKNFSSKEEMTDRLKEAGVI